ncbi:PREDICTED: calcium-binding protein CML37 isoform X2 [Camelina sativa]|nr:PREDICTED: calcium-binding protein CML37 isoform X4 [Camelina sativa]XP_010445909.2 PREDICTED: calcium-binding protein CML37 isoform X3 [Camelina sativa]XP_019087188.1 PREDICTED: calcium-binding protein CML37 isoform X1 [Camelina sativa]XP_019087189.1 PREDICTED: calcium-binding protein CML37 isoform X2 [Camelina sativa]
MSLSKNQKSPLSRLYKKYSKRKSESSRTLEDEARTSSSSGSSSLNVDELRTVFDYMDSNSDGKISGEELQSCVSLLGGSLSSREAEEVVKISDVDGDGFIDFGEFLKLMEGDDGSDEERRKELREAFGMYVMEGEEFITAASLRRTLSRLGESCTVDACKGMIRGFDQNDDGVLSFDEFVLMMR